MKESKQIKEIEIIGLFNKYHFKLDKFYNNKIIYVAYNGAFKSTVLKMIYFFLSSQLEKLDKIDFEKMTVTLEDGPPLSYENGDSDRIFREKINEIGESGKTSFSLVQFSILKQIQEKNLSMRDIGLEYLLEDNPVFKNNLLQIKKEILKNVFPIFSKWTILYLPTFRVVEREFEEIYDGIESVSKKFVSSRIQQERQDILSSLNYTKKDDSPEKSDSKEEDVYTENIFMDIWNEFSREKKKLQANSIELSDFGMNSVSNLMKAIIADTAVSDRDKKIAQFVELVNRYLAKDKFLFPDEQEDEDEETEIELDPIYHSLQKKMVYENEKLEVRSRKGNHLISLEHLSSGEKQIVTLFSHLILSDSKEFFIIYDEPELSLSVLWQENLLNDIISLSNVKGLISATHSPNIIKKLLSYSRDLTDFMRVDE